MTKVNFQEFSFWFQRWLANRKVGARLGQDFCNYFYKTVGRGDHTRELFFCEDESRCQKIIYENFIEFN